MKPQEAKGEILSPGGSLADKDYRARISAPTFRVFLGIADKWGLTVGERVKLLGSISEPTYHNWVKDIPTLSFDQLERLSLILGIWKGLKLVFAESEGAMRWFKGKNADFPFGGHSPLQIMLRGSIDDLYSVRRYLDGWRGVWP